MSISKVYPAGWSVGEKLTSTQLNLFDTKLITALDKTVAGDTLSGVITVASGAGLTHASGSTETHQSGSACTFNSGSNLTVSSGTVVAATLSGSSSITLSGASSKLDVTGNGAKVDASATGALIQASAAGALIKTATGGRIQLADNDYPTLSVGHAGRTPSRCGTMNSAFVGSTWNYTGGGTMISQTTVGTSYNRYIEPWDGATLTTLAVTFTAAGGHGALPAVYPKIEIFRVPHGTISSVSLRSGGPFEFPAVGSVAIYQAGLNTITATMDQNNVIDLSQYYYHIRFTDESGANSLVGVSVYSYKLSYTSVTDMRPH